MKKKILTLIESYWKFDDNQYPMSSWHDKQDLIKAIEDIFKSKKVSVAVCSNRFCKGGFEYSGSTPIKKCPECDWEIDC